MKGKRDDRRAAKIAFVGLLWALLPGWARASERAWDILGSLRRAEESRQWQDARGVATLTIELDGGGELSRRFRFFRKRGEGGALKTLTVFDYPPEAAGTAVLREQQWGHCDRAWILQPALRRIRRLAPTMAGGNLGGDLDPLELSLAWDLWRWRREEADALWEGSEVIAGETCERVLLGLKTSVCGFEALRAWISEQGWVVRRAQLFHSAGTLWKTIDFTRIDWIDGHPSAVLVEISRPEQGSRSRLAVNEITYDTGLRPQLFQLGQLGASVNGR